MMDYAHACMIDTMFKKHTLDPTRFCDVGQQAHESRLSYGTRYTLAIMRWDMSRATDAVSFDRLLDEEAEWT